ncbi:hypothetical protein [Planosporangium mesophilum]|uniref:Uncharacterized protein n=1 Tax=Planosporangium mesophilum TaxID=689768 RepID=A0A8J3TI80_9ACTN|nr:hypothetical protein [Planosporangium mesophilum]NJC83767.1 hypothetical protein [Planosporangium mesophilum]GII26051.1 hypothetical protein Pme01_56480 [Planosporangium mesophilum]
MSALAGPAWSPEQLVYQVDLSTEMLRAGVHAVDGREWAGPTTKRRTWWSRRRGLDSGIPRPRVADVRADEVAGWMTGGYGRQRYPAVVVGSPHVGALHLAAALGAPWLPAGFRLSVRCSPTESRRPLVALRQGRTIAAHLLDTDPGIAVYQRCDPIGQNPCGNAMLDFYVKWTAVPGRLRRFLTERLAPGGTVVLIRDCRGWPATQPDDGYRFQVGTVGSGLSWPDYCRQLRRLSDDGGDAPADEESRTVPQPDGGDVDAEQGIHPGLLGDLRRWSGEHGRRLRIVAITDSAALSAAVADVYRSWLRAAGKTGNRLVIGCGTMLDPWQVVRAGLVPYWCPRPLHSDVDALEYWLAGSEPFRSIDLLVEPPGRLSPKVVPRDRLAALPRFATDRGVLDSTCRRNYPLGIVDPRHISRVLSEQPYDSPPPPPLSTAAAIEGLDRLARYGRLLVT